MISVMYKELLPWLFIQYKMCLHITTSGYHSTVQGSTSDLLMSYDISVL